MEAHAGERSPQKGIRASLALQEPAVTFEKAAEKDLHLIIRNSRVKARGISSCFSVNLMEEDPVRLVKGSFLCVGRASEMERL